MARGSASAPATPSSFRTFAAALGACALTIAWLYRFDVISGHWRFIGDQYDSLIQAARLEHWYGVFRGWFSWRNPIFFYPTKGVLGLNDGYFLYGVAYSLFRTLGLNQLFAMELTNLAVRALGFLASFQLLTRFFRLRLGWALLGAALFTGANSVYMLTIHTQLMTVALLPVCALMLLYLREALLAGRLGVATAWACGLAFLIPAWLFTALYPAWFSAFFLAVLFLLAAAIRPQQVAREALSLVAERHWFVWIPALVLFAAALIPLALTYGPTAKTTGGGWGLDVALYWAPRPQDLINLGPGNLVWEAPLHLLDRLAHLDMIEATNSAGFTPGELVGLLVFAALGWRLLRAARDDEPLAWAWFGALAVVAGLAIEVKLGGRWSLWAVVSKVVPGAKGLRVISRFDLVLIAVSGLVLAVVLDRLARRGGAWRWAAIGLGLFLLLEQVNTHSLSNLTPSQAALATDPRGAPPAACKVFYGEDPAVEAKYGPGARDYYSNAVLPMLIAETYRTPTLNGVDTVNPPDYRLDHPLAPDYPYRAYEYARRHGLTNGICALDLKRGAWRVLTAPPPEWLAKTEALRQQKLVTLGTPVSFGAGGRTAALTDGDGWSGPEDWGVWATGKTSTLELYVDPATLGARDLVLQTTMRAYLPPGQTSKPLSVSRQVAPGAPEAPLARLTLAPDPRPLSLCVPRAQLPPDGLLRLVFHADQSWSPSAEPNNHDTRVLDFALFSLTATPGDCHAQRP